MISERPSYVALFDVLGFRRMVMAKGVADTGALLVELGMATDNLKVKSIQFSDTILLYTEGTESGKLTDLVKAAVRLMGNFAEAKISLRAAIAAGEFWHNQGVFVGKAMIRAYDLQQDQDWMGGIVDPLLTEQSPTEVSREVEALVREGLLVEYEAPVKGGGVGRLLCIGWPRNYRLASSPLATAPADSWDVMRKDHNTQRFLDWYKSRPEWQKLPRVEPEYAEKRTTWTLR